MSANPVALGVGSPLFAAAAAQHRFTSVSAQAFECGVVVHHLEAWT